MKKTKQKQIAGVSYDTFIDKAKKEPAPKVERKKYSICLIAFLDVLGIKRLIEENTRGKEHIAINKIEEMRKIVITSLNAIEDKEDFDYLQISDSFVFICKPDSIVLLIELLSTIQTRILQECNFLLRGAITVGDAIVREDAKFIIGPAYIQAYQLQEKDAIYPRIIVDKSAVKEIEKGEKPVAKYLKQDLDKEYFVNYMRVYMDREKLKKDDMRIRLKRDDTFDYLRRDFKKHYDEENHNICQKYGWTMEYYKTLGVWEDE